MRIVTESIKKPPLKIQAIRRNFAFLAGRAALASAWKSKSSELSRAKFYLFICFQYEVDHGRK